MIRCCKDCPDRHVGCHSKCEKYAKDKMRNDLAKLRRKKEYEKFSVHVSYKTEHVNGYRRHSKIKYTHPKGMR